MEVVNSWLLMMVDLNFRPRNQIKSSNGLYSGLLSMHSGLLSIHYGLAVSSLLTSLWSSFNIVYFPMDFWNV